MIHHLSIEAEHPENVAQVLAEFMGGVCVPFPVHPGAFMAFACDQHGTEVEVYPAGTLLVPGAEGTEFDRAPCAERTVSHFALSVDMSKEQVFKLAEKHGWRAQWVNRIESFPLVEVWIENKTLVEVLVPEEAEIYLNVTRGIADRVSQGLDPMAKEQAE
ncbi:hypothetical protein ACQ856_29370 (plasmid) [Mycolicibacterium psychrotolerans]|uniref:hypothetical protein n=1 Tax=Mycolicibacterium psychrotolerans TaxID=216929 RepID=UPI003D67E71F